MTIRRLQLKDLAEIERIERESYATPWSRSMFAGELSKASSVCLGALDGDEDALVGYLIVDLAARGLSDAPAFLRAIEAALVDALGALGLPADTRPGMTGVFVAGSAPPRKLASIGVGLRGWVSFHGFALNVTLDPAEFAVIVPCGLRDVAMTSVARELGAAPLDLPERVLRAVTACFLAEFARVDYSAAPCRDGSSRFVARNAWAGSSGSTSR